MSTNDLNLRIKLVSAMGLSLHRYGTNAYRLEESLTEISNALGMKAKFFSTPTYLALAFQPLDDLNEGEITKHLRVVPGEANLRKLQRLDTLGEKICNNQIDIKDALIALNRIESDEKNYPQSLVIFAFGLVSLAVSLLLHGDYFENILSGLLGLIVGTLHMTKSKFEGFANIYEFVVSALVSIIGYCVFNFYKPFSFQVVLISSLIVIIPGLSLTVAILELATQNLASGTARLMGALVDLLKLAFGIYIGISVSQIFFFPIDYLPGMNHASWVLPTSVFLAAIGFNIVFNAKKKDFIWILYAGVTSVATLKIAELYLNPTLATLSASFAVGTASNLYSRLKNQPVMVMLLPGIIFMVPGSIGLRGLSFFMQNDFMNGFSSGFQMFSVAISIVAGLFFSNFVIPPRKGL